MPVPKIILFTILLLTSLPAIAQPKLEMTPQGFAPVDIPRPPRTNEKLIELSRDWAAEHNRREHDVYDVTQNGLKIDGVRQNAFYYRNRGETYHYNIRYTLAINFGETAVSIHFSVKDIFVRQTLSEKTIADFFAPDGRLKSDYLEVKPSLEETVNKIVGSYIEYISR